MGRRPKEQDAEPERRGIGMVPLERFTVHVAAFHWPGTSRWLIAAWPDPHHPIVGRADGLVVAIWKQRYNEEKARALFRRVIEAIGAKDLSGLRKTCRHWERDDEFFCIAFGMLSDREAMAIRRENEAQLALFKRFRAGEISEEEWEMTRRMLDVSMAKHRTPAMA